MHKLQLTLKTHVASSKETLELAAELSKRAHKFAVSPGSVFRTNFTLPSYIMIAKI